MPVADPAIDYDPVGVAELLRTRSLSVPTYQRSYAWITEATQLKRSSPTESKFQVAEFWDDLSSSFSRQDAYFLGTVVLAKTAGNRQMVIDGQQRLATASLLLAAIRDKCRQGGEDDAANSTQQEYLGKYDKTEKKIMPSLILNTDDHEFYERHVVNEEVLAPAGFSQGLIDTAYRFLRERIAEFASSHGTNWEPQLTALEQWLDRNVKVVAITVPSESDAFLIFETLNDRGADLTVADLLKNYLFSKAGTNRLAEVQKNWTLTLGNLGLNEVGNQLFTTFARHLLSSKYGLVRERDVYRRLKEIVKNQTTAAQFTTELVTASRLYYALMNADSDYWSSYPMRVSEAAAVIAELQIERYRPLVMAVLSTFSKKESEEFLVALVSWSVRMLAAGSLGGGVAESAFCEAAVEVRAKKVTTTAEILTKTKVGALVPSDDLFEAAFREWEPTPKLSRYLLRALELASRGETEPELKVNEDTESVNLEHILPRNAKASDWPAFTSDSRKAMVGLIGNHALLKKSENLRIGNRPWSEKKAILAKSALKLTSETATNKDWTETEIRGRQNSLAHLARTCWPRGIKP